MARVLRRLHTLGRMLLPHGFHELERRRVARTVLTPDIAALLQANAFLKNRHAGQRCFILGNGPSVASLDLEQLKGEVVLSVSNGYLHKGFANFAPTYHCVPQITYGRMTEGDVVRWFGEMHERSGAAELFLSTTEADLVRKHQLFSGRVVRYLHLKRSFDELQRTEIIDISQPVPGVESVTIMALMIAMYAGFKEIVLLGVDHDSWKTGTYAYAFNLETQTGKDVSVDSDNAIRTPNYETFQSLARLWRQYRKLSIIANACGVNIVNASGAGELDEFETVSPTRYKLLR